MTASRHIAIACETNHGLDSDVCQHFGRAPYFAVVHLDDHHPGAVSVAVVANPAAQNHQPGQIPAFIKAQGADAIITGGMGRRALLLFDQYGIEVAGGASGNARTALQSWLDGELNAAAPCRQSEQHHAAGHHHDH